MGIGDEIMATGIARGAAARGKKIAFGDGRRLIRGPWSEIAFRHNPNIAQLANEPNIEWRDYHKGNRWYNKADNGRWIWNYDFRPTPGEFFFDQCEQTFRVARPGAVLIEPNVPWQKPVAPNKDWGLAKYQTVADALLMQDIAVYQLSHGEKRLYGVAVLHAPDFRCAVAALAGFDLLIAPEGGLHHAAAAVGVPAIVLFGGFIPPAVTGYDGHVNLTGGAEACGSWRACAHCREAMQRISVDEVIGHATQLIGGCHAAR